MIIINARNVHDALSKGLALLQAQGILASSRNGSVVRMKCPVTTIYEAPMERVELHPWRDSNPFFHFYESLWMLAGRNDIAPLTRYVKRMETFSDNGITQNAAYGYRWRNDEVDQLRIICDRLKENPESRQEVLQIWDHRLDLGTYTKDHACNIAATFQIYEDHLDMSVFCRSNDAIWGAHGSNAVHFSMLQEYVARRVGVSVGTYSQISVNYHAYVDIFQKLAARAGSFDVTTNPYCDGYDRISPYPITQVGCDFDKWDEDCRAFVTADGTAPMYSALDRKRVDPFFTEVAWPIVKAHDVYKTIIDPALVCSASVSWQWWQLVFDTLTECRADDWRIACENWMMRRRDKITREEKL